MPPVVIDLARAEDPRDAVHRAVQALAEGKLVALPTETVYTLAASALCESAVARLLAVSENAERPLTLAVKSADDALDFVPQMATLPRRLARRCWPGPVILMLPDKHPDSVIRQLPDCVQQAVVHDGWQSLRVPAHCAVTGVLRLSAGPLVLAGIQGQAEALSTREVLDAVGDKIDMVVDDGPSKFGQPASVVKVDGRRLTVVRAGVLAATTLRRLADLMVLVVCTGNTCRSPMGESMLKKRLADKLGCKPDELESRGVMVMSAGIAAGAGARAAAEAISAMKERGLDLSRHESQPLSERLVRYADLVISMTKGHRDAIIAQWPEAAGRVMPLSAERDIPDPIGGPADLYRRCAEQIDGHLARWVDELDLESIPLPE
jgi:protein-tyrosine phosphatase